MAAIKKRNGSYSTRVSLTDPLTGKRSQPRVTAATKAALRAEVARVRHEHASGQFIEPERTTLAAWCAAWHVTYKRSPASRYKRSVHIANHIAADAIGAIPLSRLRYAHVQDWIDRKALTLAPNTLRSLLATLSLALKAAVRRRLISSNPALGVELPPTVPARWCVLDETQARRIVLESGDDALHAWWVLAVSLGIRRGELLVLGWDSVDLRAGEVRIEHTMSVDDAGHRRIGDTAKSVASRRTIALPAVCVDALRQQRARQNERRLAAGDVWAGTGTVFDSGLGERLGETALYTAFRRLRERLDLPETMRLHDLRHTAATLMLRAGVPIPTVSQILGHADPTVTMRVYSHVLRAMEVEAAVLIDGMFRPDRAQIVPTADG